MRAAIFNPYLDSLGGGERYSMAFAPSLLNKGYDVDVEWKGKPIKRSLEERFGIDLGKVSFVKSIKRGDGYDICFWVSDGSIPLLRARHNFLHFQIPFKDVSGKSLLNKMKFFRIEKIICNSKFTKETIDKEYAVESVVIYPPVDTENIKPKLKENLIVAVGRFSQLTQAKRQDILVDVFVRMLKGGLEGWKLVLAGGVDVGVADYVNRLKKRIEKHTAIQILESPDFGQIKDLYGKAKIFWSASGYGIDDRKEPKKVEHFGITVVEAMAAGAVPVIYD